MATYRRGRDELKVGLFAIAAVLVFTLMFGALTSRGVVRRTSDLYVLFPTAEGLLKGDAVMYRGVPVGDVRKIAFLGDRGVLVRAKLHRAVPLDRGAAATLTPVDMFGRQAIALREGVVGGAPLADGDTLVGERPSGMADRVDVVGRQIERFLADTTLALLQDALLGLGRASYEVQALGLTATGLLDSRAEELAEVSVAASTVALNLAAATDSAELIALREDLRLAVAGLARAGANMDSASASVAGVFTKLDEGHGSLGLLLNDTSLHDRTVRAIEALEQLAVDVRVNPRRYITLKVF